MFTMHNLSLFLQMKIIPVYKYVVVQDTVKKEFSWAGGILQSLYIFIYIYIYIIPIR